MKRLTLLRHAKASRDDPSLRDFDRPLTKRGRADAARIGAHLAALRLAPDFVICSPALRTRETLELVANHLAPNARELFVKSLYRATPDAIISAIAAAPDGAAHILAVGHNPGLYAVALNLADLAQSDAPSLTRLSESFPPGAFAHYEIDVAHWVDLPGARGALRHFAAPKELGENGNA